MGEFVNRFQTSSETAENEIAKIPSGMQKRHFYLQKYTVTIIQCSYSFQNNHNIQAKAYLLDRGTIFFWRVVMLYQWQILGKYLQVF